MAPESTGHAAGKSSAALGETVRQVLISGAALTVPLVITVMVLVFVINFILRAITPVVRVANEAFGIGQNVDPFVMKLLAIATFVAMVFVLGLVAETRSGDRLERVFDTAMARIPGVGSVYTSFNEMTELLLSNDTRSFREVKLVEFPCEGSYSIAFVTADSPPTIGDSTGHDDMTTLFMPLAPNPVMGGYVVHVSEDRVYDVDLTVEEGIRSIVTSGVATGNAEEPDPPGELVDLQTIRRQARDGVEDLGAWGTRTVDDLSDFTGNAAEDIRKQAYREFAAVHPDLDESELDDEREVRHYMLDQFEDVDGAESTVGARSSTGDQPDDGDGTVREAAASEGESSDGTDGQSAGDDA